MVTITQESSASLKNIRPLSARKIKPVKTSARKKVAKIPESSKILRRISPKILSPQTYESFTARNQTSGRTLSTEFTVNSPEVNKALVKLEREHSDLMSLYSKMSDELLHLKTLEKLEKQREKQINQIKARLNSNAKETVDIQNSLKISESILKDFTKKMEKGGLTAEEKRSFIKKIKGFLNGKGEPENEVFAELWELLPKTEKLLNRLENK